uniref:tRNA methyltransferase O n=3 Tax=Canis lupus TaxID=9612 RepID=A0A8C0T0F6_CANLF
MRGSEEPGSRPAATPCGCVKPALETGNLLTEPIGYLESCFSAKNGTPRQPSICSHSRACLRIRKSIFNNPEHSLMGLEQFSHVWILFVFHKNGHLSCKAKVQPPRLNGAKTGVFSTRSPHRPNAIGLTLAKLEKLEDGSQSSFKYFQSAEEARHAIEAVLSADPRSIYRRKLCQDRLFYFTVDIAHITCWFGDDFAEVLRIKPASEPVQMTDLEEYLVSLGS